jgi:hypothetical protein
MPNTSATGGYLLPDPAPAPAPLEGQALLRFFQQVIVGITGLPNQLVRPYWQEESPDIPDPSETTAWAAFRIVRRPSDEYPFVGRLPYQAEAGVTTMQRHEVLNIATTFYDLGSTGPNNSGGQADNFAALLRDGLLIAQNREPLTLAGMGLVKTGDLVTVPVVFKSRWQYRVDLEWEVRREISRTYSVLTIVSATGDIYYDTGLPAQPFNAT